jgi:O-antigen/teichoic acid export membrane protein
MKSPDQGDSVRRAEEGVTQSPRRGGGLVSSVSLTLVTRIAAFGFSLVTNVILARSLGPEGRGIYAVAVLIPSIIAVLAQLGIGPANVYYFSKGLISLEDLVAHSTSLAFVLGTACFALVFAYVKLSGSGHFLGIGSQFVLVACLGVPFIMLTVFLQGILQGSQRFIYFNAVLLTQYGSPTLVLIAALLVFHKGTLGAVIAWTASTVATAAVAAYSVSSVSRLSMRMRRSTLKSLLRFGLISYLGSLTSFVNYRFDVLIVNLFAGARQVGLYSVGTGLAEIVWYVSNAASIVVAPRAASAEQKDADRLVELVCRVVLALTVVAAGVLAVSAPFVVVAFFGSAFAESVWAVWLLMPGIVTLAVGRILSVYLLGRNRLKVDLLASFVGLVVTVALDFALIPRYGFRGAAVASSVAYTCAMAVDLFWVVRNSTITPWRLLIPRPSDATLLWRRINEAGLMGLVGLQRRQPASHGNDSGGTL